MSNTSSVHHGEGQRMLEQFKKHRREVLEHLVLQLALTPLAVLLGLELIPGLRFAYLGLHGSEPKRVSEIFFDGLSRLQLGAIYGSLVLLGGYVILRFRVRPEYIALVQFIAIGTTAVWLPYCTWLDALAPID